eukprot:scaffold5845_cov135-Pinguiococcus_pyrenoidosus.AAC.1
MRMCWRSRQRACRTSLRACQFPFFVDAKHEAVIGGGMKPFIGWEIGLANEIPRLISVDYTKVAAVPCTILQQRLSAARMAQNEQ